jgi:hypothetical protein
VEDSDTTTTTTTSTTPGRDLPAVVDYLIPQGYGTQDFLIHVDLQLLRGSEEGESIYSQVVEAAEGGAEEGIALSDGFQFRPTDWMSGVVRDAAGNLLPSIALDFGLLSIDPDEAARLIEEVRERLPAGADVDLSDLGELRYRPLLVEFSTADLDQTPVNVMLGDVSDVDLSFVEGFEAGDRLRSIYFWGQTLATLQPRRT